MPFDLTHLDAETAELALRSTEERIRPVWQECWIGDPAAMRTIQYLKWLYSLEQRQRMPHMVLLGVTNNGKSTVIRRFMLDHPVRTAESGDYEEVTVLYFENSGAIA